MDLWLIILGMVAVTYIVRLSVIALVGEAAMPDSLTRALRFVPPAALSAIIFPALFLPEGSLDLSTGQYAPAGRAGRGAGGVAQQKYAAVDCGGYGHAVDIERARLIDSTAS